MPWTEVMESCLLFQNIFISRRSEVANFADVIKILLINKPTKLEVLESKKKGQKVLKGRRRTKEQKNHHQKKKMMRHLLVEGYNFLASINSRYGVFTGCSTKLFFSCTKQIPTFKCDYTEVTMIQITN